MEIYTSSPSKDAVLAPAGGDRFALSSSGDGKGYWEEDLEEGTFLGREEQNWGRIRSGRQLGLTAAVHGGYPNFSPHLALHMLLEFVPAKQLGADHSSPI